MAWRGLKRTLFFFCGRRATARDHLREGDAAEEGRGELGAREHAVAIRPVRVRVARLLGAPVDLRVLAERRLDVPGTTKDK